MKRYEALEKTGGFFETKLRVHKPPGFRTKFTNAIPSAHFVLREAENMIVWELNKNSAKRMESGFHTTEGEFSISSPFSNKHHEDLQASYIRATIGHDRESGTKLQLQKINKVDSLWVW